MSTQIHWDVSTESRALVAGLSETAIEEAVRKALVEGGRDGLVVSVVFVSDEVLSGLHGRFLGDESPTDVITFDLCDPGDAESLGGGDDPGAELYVSVDAALRCAQEHELTVENELLLYVVHGTLHLCGFDDHDEADRRSMRRAELRVFEHLGIALDAERHERS